MILRCRRTDSKTRSHEGIPKREVNKRETPEWVGPEDPSGVTKR